ncbi:MAG: carboxypeptidase regulatory-like domain-containing protein [Vicinamibacterales bacterium]
MTRQIASTLKASLLAMALFVLVPSLAHAQSSFTGVVKDTSGAVLPGVTVEAASPVLIEKTRSVITDSTGGYRLTDLRPGVYTVTFSLEGFSTVKREGVELPANFTMTLNGDMKVGSLEETLTVTGAAPTVDVQSTTKSQVLNREALDAIPTGRTIQGMGQLITGVSLNIPDVGGSRAMQQTYMSTHGLGASQTTVQVDGLIVNGLDGDGAVQNYFNSSMSQEMVYTTSGAGADVSGGGVRLNMIPRDGGNRVSGSLFSGYQDKSFQTSNLTQDLKNRGVKTPDGIGKLWNVEGSLGGPIKKDKIWYFGSARAFHLNTLPADALVGIPGTALPNRAPTPSTEAGVDPQSINSFQARIVWQMSQKMKLSAYNDRLLKNRGADMVAGVDPATASGVWRSPLYTTGSVKLSYTASSRILVEGGFSANLERYTILAQDGITKQRFTPDWYTQIYKTDVALGTQWNFIYGAENFGRFPDRYAFGGSVSYVTGSHNVKVGIQDTWGTYRRTDDANGDIRAIFNNGTAIQAQILNSPVERFDQLHADVGVFAQDSWTLKRLTVNYGARYEHFAHGIPKETSPAGRFTAARTFGPIDMPTWNSISPRGGLVYDIFGNQRTALKFSIGKYMQAGSTGFSESYNPLQLTAATVAWTDANLDGVPQGELGCVYQTAGCEINLAQLPTGFGVASLANFDPNIKRMYNVETAVSVQHEVMKGLSVTGGWYHRDYHNLRRRDNTLQTFADYTPFTLYSPIDGTPIQYNNVSLAKRSAINYVDTTAGSDRKMWFNGFEYNFNARLSHGVTIFGGGMSEKVLAQVCDEKANPNLLLYCDQTKSGIPFRTQFKIAGNVPIVYGISVGLSFQSLPGYGYGTGALSGREGGPTGPTGQPSATQLNTPNGAGTVWLITPTTTYTASSPCVAKGTCVAGQVVDPGMNVASLSVPLIAPNTEFGDRINQLDLNISKTIKVRQMSIQPKIDFFNLLNVSPVYAVRGLNYGTASYKQPSSILVGRVFQLGAIVKF